MAKFRRDSLKCSRSRFNVETWREGQRSVRVGGPMGVARMLASDAVEAGRATYARVVIAEDGKAGAAGTVVYEIGRR